MSKEKQESEEATQEKSRRSEKEQNIILRFHESTEIFTIGVASQRINSFLNTSTTRVIQPNHGRSDAHGHLHYFDHFLGMGFRKGSSKYLMNMVNTEMRSLFSTLVIRRVSMSTHRKILRKGIHDAPMNHTMSRNNTIAGKIDFIHSKLCASMCLELVDLIEGTWIKQELEAFSGAIV